jgi:hypothetical protein
VVLTRSRDVTCILLYYCCNTFLDFSADFLAAGSNISSLWFAALRVSHACKAQAFLIIFASTASFFWTSCLAIHLYLIITGRSQVISEKTKMLLFHAVSWGLPLLFSCVALGCHALGHAPYLNEEEKYIKLTTGGWCWIKKFDHKNEIIIWTMMTSKFWELASYFLITVLCWMILIQLRLKVRICMHTQPRTQVLRSDARPARYERQNEEPGYEVDRTSDLSIYLK